MSDPIQLSRYLARHGGLGSRRACEKLIADGLVYVNGERARPGKRVDAEADRVTVQGRNIGSRAGHVYYMMNKPRGVVCTASDPQGRMTVLDMARKHGITARVFSVGRLDTLSEGLLILTNDGELSNRMARPENGLPRVYEVGLSKTLDAPTAAQIRRYPRLKQEERHGRVVEAQLARNVRLISGVGRRNVTLSVGEGKYHEVRRLFAAVGINVRYLKRVAFGPVKLRHQPPGDIRPVPPGIIESLKKRLNLE